jgi:hypothetical protein
MQKKLIGFILVFASILLLVIKTKLAPIASFITWPFLLFFVCMILIAISFTNQNDKLALAAGLGAAVGLFIWGKQYVDGWSDHWSILLMLIGCAVLLQFFINKQNLTAVIALVLTLSGICAWPGLNDIASLASIAPTLNTYWPLLFFGLGVYFLLRK